MLVLVGETVSWRNVYVFSILDVSSPSSSSTKYKSNVGKSLRKRWHSWRNVLQFTKKIVDETPIDESTANRINEPDQ